LDKRFYRVDPKLRGDRVQVRFDPFASWDTLQLYSLQDEYLGTATLHNRTEVPASPNPVQPKLNHNFIDMWVRQHKNDLAEQTAPIDYRNVVQQRPWPFHEFAKTVAQLIGRRGGLADLSSADLESLKKVYNLSLSINRQMVKQAFENAQHPTLVYIIAELKRLIRKEDTHVS
jgi:hypothetical protein